MTLTYLDIYNEVSAQAWSMFDTDAENKEDFETAMSTSIQKALSEVWHSYPYPFRIKKQKIKTRAGKANYAAPNGNIITKSFNGSEVYSIRIGKDYLTYNEDYIEGTETGTPTSFYIDDNYIYLDPIPDDAYDVVIEYLTLVVGFDSDENEIYTLQNETDYLDIPEKYETLFKNVLITKAMVYVIASPEDENYPGYQQQYEEAYRILIDYCNGIEIKKRFYI